MERRGRKKKQNKAKSAEGSAGRGGTGVGRGSRLKPASSSSTMQQQASTSSPEPSCVELDDELEAEVAGHIEILKDRISMPEEEIRERFYQFGVDCPEGELSKDRFLEIAGDMLGPDANNIAETIFRVFDEDGSGEMDFCEYMLAVQATKCETPEDKLKWIFRVYDRNFSNTIETDELSAMFRTLFQVSGLEVTETQMEMLITDVMQTLDEDGNGEIDLDEFVSGSLKTQFIYELLCTSHD